MLRDGKTMYYGQRDKRGRAQIYRDLHDGTGPCRLKFAQEKVPILPDWGPQSDMARRLLLTYVILDDALGDREWAHQIGDKFSNQVAKRLPHQKFQLTARDIFNAVSVLELGVEAYGTRRRHEEE